MKLENWTPIYHKMRREPVAVFSLRCDAKTTAEKWSLDEYAVGEPVTLDLPSPPPRDPNVVAREYMQAVKRLREDEDTASMRACDRLYAEWEAVTAPKPPAEAKRGLRVYIDNGCVCLVVPYGRDGSKVLRTHPMANLAEDYGKGLRQHLRALGISVEGGE